VADAWARMDAFRQRDLWLGVTNRYRSRPSKRVTDDAKNSKVNDRQLAEFIAASVVLHCSDAWALLGRAVDALLIGHVSAAKHFAYYSELRAAMSILGYQGVGIFDHRHVVLDGAGKISTIPKNRRGYPGTHLVTWLALDYCSSQSQWGKLLEEIISPAGLPMEFWLPEFPARAPWRTLGRSWMLSWGFDLRRLGKDRDMRNDASYQPSSLEGVQSIPAAPALEFIECIWMALEPSPGSPFEPIDRFLLRHSLDETIKTRIGSLPSGSERERLVDLLLERVGVGGHESAIRAFLVTDDLVAGGVSCLFDLATSSAQASQEAMAMAARAVLLLRIASGASRQLAEAVGTPNDLRFWWEDFAIQRGLWGADDEPAALTDLWADIEESLDASLRWRTSGAEERSSALRELGGTLGILGQFERACLWSAVG